MDTALMVATYTVADLPEAQWPRHELIEGALYVTPLADLRHQRVVGDLYAALLGVLAQGHVVVPGCNVSPDPLTLVIPDVVVLSGEIDGVSARPEDCVLVAEVLSPSTKLRDLTMKRALYDSWNLTYWTVEPQARVITSYGAAYGKVELPGFRRA